MADHKVLELGIGSVEVLSGHFDEDTPASFLAFEPNLGPHPIGDRRKGFTIGAIREWTTDAVVIRFTALESIDVVMEELGLARKNLVERLAAQKEGDDG